MVREGRLSEVCISLQKRNYPDTAISDGIKKTISILRDTLLITHEKHREKVIPYVSTYNPNNAEMVEKKIHAFSTNDQTMRGALSGTKIKSNR